MPVSVPAVAYMLFLAFGVVHWSLQHKIYRRLQERHPECWKALGSPTIWTGGVFSRFPYYRFVWLGASSAVGDAEIDRGVRWLRLVEALALSALITGIVTQPTSWLDSPS